MSKYEVVHSDVIKWAQDYTGEPFMACLCDPPYSLGDGKRGFMNKAWDNDIAFQPATWAALAQHLHPGGFLMAFGGSRGFHRLACAIEDAGFVIQPTIGWLQGQGFPKATHIDTQIDKAAGAEREVVGKSTRHGGGTNHIYDVGMGDGNVPDITAAATDLARAWEGHRYGGQAMKPALEFVIVAQKPWNDPRLDCIVQTGAGALNIDGGRIAHSEKCRMMKAQPLERERFYRQGGRFEDTLELKPSGRWPSNFALCHTPACVHVGTRRIKAITGTRAGSPDVGMFKGEIRGSGEKTGYGDVDGQETIANWECAPGCPVAALGAQSGELKSGKMPAGTPRKNAMGYQGAMPDKTLNATIGDKGTAARFFHQADWSYEVAERLANSDAIRYQSKAAKREREAGLIGVFACVDCGGLDTTTHENKKGKTVTCRRNDHNTVKPIALAQWLATLLLPPDIYAPRRLLIPFGGVASEGIGALMAGWEEITVVEQNGTFCHIARARLDWWMEQVKGQMWPDVKEVLKKAKGK